MAKTIFIVRKRIRFF